MLKKKRRSNVKGKFRDIIGLMNTTLGGKVVVQDDGTYEIRLENLVYSTYMSLFIKRDEGVIKRTSITIKQGLLKHRIQRHFVSFIDLEKVFVSITPSSDVAFLFTGDGRYTVINVFKDGNIEIVHAIDKRKEEDNNGEKTEQSSDTNENKKSSSYSEKRNSFASKEQKKSTYYKDLEEKKRKERQKRKIFITL